MLRQMHEEAEKKRRGVRFGVWVSFCRQEKRKRGETNSGKRGSGGLYKDLLRHPRLTNPDPPLRSRSSHRKPTRPPDYLRRSWSDSPSSSVGRHVSLPRGLDTIPIDSRISHPDLVGRYHRTPSNCSDLLLPRSRRRSLRTSM
jgi:hypothetical protein